MKGIFNIGQFINEKITGRIKSLLADDLAANHSRLSELIGGKSVLVIGGAGTIGSSYIKAMLPFKPGKLVVVDINENGLT
ncbi:MAG: polysaccharide biosynthesis protein, partial [Chitinophagaceae bacterium]